MNRVQLHLEIAASVRRLADDRTHPDDVRRLAGSVLDLSALLETWPVPRSLKLDEELNRQLSELCRLSSGTLCGPRHCPAHDGADSERLCLMGRPAN